MLYFANWRNAAKLKGAKIVLSKSIFYVKINQIKKKIIEEYQFRRPFFAKRKNSNFNFKIRLLLKLDPILDSALLCQFTKYNIFLEAHSFFLWNWAVVVVEPFVYFRVLFLM